MKSTRKSSAGFTIIEALLAIVLVGALLVAALQTASTSATAQYKAGERAMGRYLAQGLMSDILQKVYEDPNNVTLVLGVDALSLELPTSKANYNDVDDYNGWTESPPQDQDGTVIPGFTNWSRSVLVEWVNASNISQTSATESCAKRITVTVKHNNITIATLVAIKCRVS
jgi:type II secretory pathway pseudopilin PulG